MEPLAIANFAGVMMWLVASLSMLAVVIAWYVLRDFRERKPERRGFDVLPSARTNDEER